MIYDNPYNPTRPPEEIRPAATLSPSARAHQAATLAHTIGDTTRPGRDRWEAERELRDNAYLYITALLNLLEDR